jgi:hypothetical protein
MMNSLILILDAYSAIDLLTSATTPPPSCCLAFTKFQQLGAHENVERPAPQLAAAERRSRLASPSPAPTAAAAQY